MDLKEKSWDMFLVGTVLGVAGAVVLIFVAILEFNNDRPIWGSLLIGVTVLLTSIAFISGRRADRQ